MCRMSQACAPSACHCGCMNSAASQSSSSGCVGHSPCEPRSSSDFGDARCRKTAATAGSRYTRAVSGLSLETQPVGQVEPRGAAAAGVELAQKRRNGGLDHRARIVHPVAARQNARFGGRRWLPSPRTCGMAASQQLRPRCSSWANASTSACASGAAHWKCPRRLASCSSVRSASSVFSAFSDLVRNLFALVFGGGPATIVARPTAPGGSGPASRGGNRNPGGCGRSSQCRPRSSPARRNAAPERPVRRRYSWPPPSRSWDRRRSPPAAGTPPTDCANSQCRRRNQCGAGDRFLSPRTQLGFHFRQHQAIRAARHADAGQRFILHHLDAQRRPGARARLELTV